MYAFCGLFLLLCSLVPSSAFTFGPEKIAQRRGPAPSHQVSSPLVSVFAEGEVAPMSVTDDDDRPMPTPDDSMPPEEMDKYEALRLRRLEIWRETGRGMIVYLPKKKAREVERRRMEGTFSDDQGLTNAVAVSVSPRPYDPVLDAESPGKEAVGKYGAVIFFLVMIATFRYFTQSQTEIEAY
uniref:Transmembrane protein n=1 Tax=Chromera velia CCMP2878 TaxID=1169474 RepID=A0A0G4G6P0_9ALVE|eukprot:Cvel_20493.t1-p1 / transcript=Cvel_20493.t1 / gene=Cvel_20493 / organism=Chromera_velia_CCMP2878 / gene_product=hypothetical protein / transcript_product=hypothetical protein / location=Cvel_scaffold1843:7849-9095(+) / protein_length=181 / sequence_SO=supercontig / SO=protein_coding / is_pseudo=false